MAAKKAETAKAENTLGTEAQHMYIGPSVRSLGLVSGRVYKGDYTVITAPLATKYPLINQLIVPIAKINEAKARLKQQGTAENIAAAQIVGGEN